MIDFEEFQIQMKTIFWQKSKSNHLKFNSYYSETLSIPQE